MQIELHQVSLATTEAAMRRHRVLIDRPAEKGGLDLGPMGGELFLASVAGCFMSNLLAAVKARNAPVANARVTVDGVLAEAPARFTLLELHVSAECADDELFRSLVTIADRACIMMNTLRDKLPVRIHAGSRDGSSR